MAETTGKTEVPQIAPPPSTGTPGVQVPGKPPSPKPQTQGNSTALILDTVLLPVALGLIAFGLVNVLRKLARSAGATKLVTGYPLSCDLCSAFWGSITGVAAWFWLLRLPLDGRVMIWGLLVVLGSTGVSFALLRLLFRLEASAPEPPV